MLLLLLLLLSLFEAAQKSTRGFFSSSTNSQSLFPPLFPGVWLPGTCSVGVTLNHKKGREDKESERDEYRGAGEDAVRDVVDGEDEVAAVPSVLVRVLLRLPC